MRKQRRRLTGPAPMKKPYVPRIALRSIDGHLARTATTVTAWYRLSPQRWSYQSDATRHELITAVAGQYAELQGRWLHIRVTTRPYPISEWAEAHVRRAGRDALPDVPGALSWDEYMIGEQMHAGSRVMADKEIYLGVELRRRTMGDQLVERAAPLLRRISPAAVDAELLSLDADVQHIDQVITAPGLLGRPVTPAEMRWLMYRSCTLGLPAGPGADAPTGTGHWEATDLAALTDGAEAWCDAPYAPTVTVTPRGLAGTGERHVAVLSLGLMQEMHIPEGDAPWMAKADGLGHPPEWSARVYVRHANEVQTELTHQMAKVSAQVRHFSDEHGVEPPQQLSRQHGRASDIDDELSAQWDQTKTRVKGWWRVAVSGATRAEALRAAQNLADLYKPKIAIEHPEAQYHHYREFIPGEPLASVAHQRRMSVLAAATAMPTATARVGDRQGVLLGTTVGTTCSPVAWDPWAAQERRDKSGLTAVVGGLGSGKSFLCGGLVYKTVRAGAYWTLLDPSGPLARLCQLPELRPYAQEINLLDAEPGTLNPYRLVPEPRVEHFAGESNPGGAFARAQSFAASERRALVQDALAGVLPHDLAHDQRTRIVLMEAVRAAGDHPANHPGMVIDQLLEITGEYATHARAVYGFLDEARPRLTLLIPESAESDPYRTERDCRLTVLTMPGLALPKEGVPRAEWNDGESLGVVLLSLAAWLTQRRLYSGDPSYQSWSGRQWKDARKGVWIDEAFFLTQVGTGRTLMTRFARDSRKWNARILLSSQVPGDFLDIKGFTSLVDAVFVGNLTDDEVQADALRLLKVRQNAGYEETLSGLGGAPQTLAEDADASTGEHQRVPRRFIFNDGAGGIEQIRIDFGGEHLEHVRAALDTTPSSKATLASPAHRQLQVVSARRGVA